MLNPGVHVSSLVLCRDAHRGCASTGSDEWCIEGVVEGNQTTYTRDTSGNVTLITYPTVTSPATQAAEKSITYNTYGQVLEVEDEEDKLTRYTYVTAHTDSFGLLSKIEVDPNGLDLETTLAYDCAGNVTSVTDPRGNATTSTFDNLRRLTKRTLPWHSAEVKYEHDANGNLTKKEVENLDKDGDSVTANPWITTTYTYSTEDQLLTIVEEVDASTTRTTTLAYDDNGNRIRVTRPEGNKDKWTFNERDLVASHTRGETATEASTSDYTYDENGNLTEIEDGRGNATTYTYDLFDRRTVTTTPLGHYTELTLDENGRATKVSRKNSSDAEIQQSNRYFDERGRLWKISDVHKDPGTTYSNAVTEIERYKTGHVKTKTNARDKDTDYAYDNAWRRTKVTDAMGNWTAWTLDENGNATEWEIKEIDGAGSVTHDFEATFDALNRRLTYVEIDRTNSSNELTTTYGFDSRSNLVWQVNAEGNPTRWTFDAAGRMTKKEVALSTGATIEDFTTAIQTEWTFDKNNRLTAHEDDAANKTMWTFAVGPAPRPRSRSMSLRQVSTLEICCGGSFGVSSPASAYLSAGAAGNAAGSPSRRPALSNARSAPEIVWRDIRSSRSIYRCFRPIRCRRTSSCNLCTSVLLAAIGVLLGSR